jgi:hypothetical protein
MRLRNPDSDTLRDENFGKAYTAEDFEGWRRYPDSA